MLSGVLKTYMPYIICIESTIIPFFDFAYQPSTTSLLLSELPSAAKFFKISLVKS